VEADGKELYFVAPDRRIMAVNVRKDGGRLEIGSPVALFDSRIVPGADVTFDVGPDGRFLVPVQEQTTALPMTLVFNWQPGLR